MLLGAAPPPVAATSVRATPPSIVGLVVDAQTGLALPDTVIRIVGAPASTVSDASGRFAFTSLAAGSYRLTFAHLGYQPATTGDVVARVDRVTPVTVALERASNGLDVIVTTSVRRSATLQRSGTFYRSIPTETLQRAGITRAGDALRELPGIINGITGDTGAFSDDINLNIRGIGTLETETTIDGHPIGFGMPGGYNFEISPIFGLRDLSVTYGSGASTLGSVDAIGGVVDFQTLDPTPERRVAFQQGFGSFDRYATGVRATGTAGRLGYALAYGVSYLDGPFRHAPTYQPGAAFDQSATLPAVRNLAVYPADSSAVARSGLFKVRYALSNASSLTFTLLANAYWDDKTGNGDTDYLDYAPALVFGAHLLAVKPGSDLCPAGTFTAKNVNGRANGTGPGGTPDGGIACQTPSQYAGFNAGFQGSGPAWQSFDVDDEHLAFVHETDRATVRADLFGNLYRTTFDRTATLPFATVPDDKANWRNRAGIEFGASASDELHLRDHDLGFGASYLNDTYRFSAKTSPVLIPATNEAAFFVRDAYHRDGSPLTAYVNAWFKRASATQSSYVDPRLSLVYSAGKNDVLRAAIGRTTTQPSADQLGKSFVASPPASAGGGASVTCSGLNSIGTAPSSVLHPENGVDEELAYGHRFQGDTQVQLSVYNVNVFDKLYSTLQPIAATGTSFIDPAYLASVSATISAKCGVADPTPLLGVSGTFNVGQLRARGFTLDGRVRFSSRLYADYEWDLTSTALVSAPIPLLQANKTLVLGDQLAHLPLHTFVGSLDATVGRIDLRYTLHVVSANNTKALPAYDYSDLLAGAPFGPGVVTMSVGNLFDQYADARGLRYEGVPLDLNPYATAADYAPVTGASATERFGLPFRTLYFNYTWRL